MKVNKATLAHGVEKRLLAAAWRDLMRAPVQRAAEFSVAGGARLARMWNLAALLLMALPAAIMLAAVLAGLGARGLLIVGAQVLLVSLYFGALLIGGRRVLRESGHDISLDFLKLDLGLHGSATLPMASVLRAHRADIVAVLAPDDVWMLAPFDVPNVLVELDGLVDIAAQRFGYPSTLRRRYIALYVDEPVHFLAAVAHALPGKLRAVA